MVCDVNIFLNHREEIMDFFTLYTKIVVCNFILLAFIAFIDGYAFKYKISTYADKKLGILAILLNFWAFITMISVPVWLIWLVWLI
jgi:hypothetical protein